MLFISRFGRFLGQRGKKNERRQILRVLIVPSARKSSLSLFFYLYNDNQDAKVWPRRQKADFLLISAHF